jgi:muramoyltetrapeptide carboxypeptidase
VLLDRLGGLGVPLVIGLPFGHGPVQLTVPLGAPAVLDATAGVLRVG